MGTGVSRPEGGVGAGEGNIGVKKCLNRAGEFIFLELRLREECMFAHELLKLNVINARPTSLS